MYDIIGDIHGERASLEALLKKLGYCHGDSGWSHPERTVVFVGDFIDRGPDSLGVCRIAREMVEGGAALAVMGNHEINALAFHTTDPDQPGAYLRPHSEKNITQHRATLDSFQDNESELDDTLEWFATLPLWLDLGDIRVIHAAWHIPSSLVLAEYLDERHALSPGALVSLHRPGTKPFKAMEILLKGVEVKLPDGITFIDKEGIHRNEARIRWWLDDLERPWPDVVLGDRALREQLPSFIATIDGEYGYPPDAVPVFIGHYWLKGTPEPLAPNIACVDYSVPHSDGKLVAYRWEGEAELEAEQYFSVSRQT